MITYTNKMIIQLMEDLHSVVSSDRETYWIFYFIYDISIYISI